MADNSTQGGTDTIRDKDRTGVKTQIFGQDLNIGGGSEVLQTAAALADATANPTVPAWAAMGMLFNGTTWDRMRGDTTNGLDVDVTRLPALPAGTNNIGDVDVLTLPGSPAQEHTTAGSPGSARLSDGSAFYDAAKTGQLPSTLGQKTTANSVSVTLPSDISPVAIVGSVPAQGTATWTSATSLNTAVTVSGVAPYGSANISIQVPSTVTAGVITLEVSDDSGTTYYPAGAVRADNTLAENAINLQLTAGTANSRMYLVSLDGFTNLRARLSTAITGSGNVLVRISPAQQGVEPLVSTIPPRVMCCFSGTLSATPITETFVTLTPVRGVTAGSAGTSMTVTANKTLRITSITLAVQNITTAAVVPIPVTLKAKASGTIATTDPVIWRARLGNNSAVVNTVGWLTHTFPDGLDLPSGSAFGVSEVAASTNGFLEVSVNGYEF